MVHPTPVCALLFSVLLLRASQVHASRVQVSDTDGDADKTTVKFGASCDDLESMFRNRVVAFQHALDADAGRIRLMMRSYSVIRTLRRARTCSWVVEGDSVDIEQMRGIVQTLVAENPCAEAARAELEAGASHETSEIEARKLAGSISILLSDNCEIIEPEAETTADLEVEVSEAEAVLQDEIDHFADAPENEAAALIQNNASTFEHFMRRLGVVFLFLLLLLACSAAAAAIGLLLGLGILILANSIGRGFALGDLDKVIVPAVLGGAGLGLAGCGYQLYTQLLA